jgi:ferredoxin
MAMYIDGDECTTCGECELVCPTGAIVNRKGVLSINAKVCTECDGASDEPQCLAVCPLDDCIRYLEA